MTGSACMLRIRFSISSSVRRVWETVIFPLLGSSSSPYSVATQIWEGMDWLSRNSAVLRPSVVPANTRTLHIFIASRRHHPAADFLCLGIADEDCGKHIHFCLPQLFQSHDFHLFPISSDIAHNSADSVL